MNATALADLIRDADSDTCNDISDELVENYGRNRANLLWADANRLIEQDEAGDRALNALADAALARINANSDLEEARA